MLNPQEQGDLYAVYAAAFGDDATVKAAQVSFNEMTVDAVETAIGEVIKCNGLMKELVSNLLGGASSLYKGWLKKGLRKLSKALKDENVKFNGYACQATSKWKWRDEILSTTI